MIIAFALANGGSGGEHQTATDGPLPPIAVSAPPSSSATTAPCAQVISALPVKLGPLAPRIVHTTPESPNVVAWGDPPVVLRCGVPRPAGLRPGSSEQVFLTGNVYWLPVQHKDVTVFTSIDRSVYVEVSLPRAVSFQPLPILGRAIATKLKAVCAVPDDGTASNPARLCTHRS